MTRINCSGIIFHDESRILLEDRRKIKKHGEHWSFFGGVVEEGETPEQALKREIKEELSYNLKKYSFFKKYNFNANKDLKLTYYMFAAPMPNTRKVKSHRNAGLKKFTFRQALKLKITSIDKQAIRDLQAALSKGTIKKLI